MVIATCWIAVSLCACGAAQAAPAHTGQPAPERSPNEFVPTVAPPARFASAEKLFGHLSGASKREPDACGDLSAPASTVIAGSDNTGSIDVSPAATEAEEITTSTTYRYCIIVHNRQRETHFYSLSTVDLQGSDSANQQIDVLEPPIALGHWIHPAVTTFTLKPGERITVPYLLEVPASVPAGTVIGGIRVSQESAGGPATGARIRPGLIQRIYITFPGGEARKMTVSGVRAPHLMWRSRHERVYTAHMVVKNDGTVVDSFRTVLDVKVFGHRVGSATTEPVALLPGSSVRVDEDWDDVPWIGWYRPVLLVKSRTGTTRVELPTLWVLPPVPYLVAIVVAVLFPVFLLVWRWRRRRAEWLAYYEALLEEEDLEEYEEIA